MAKGGRPGGGGGELLGINSGNINPTNIRDMVSQRGTLRQETDEVLSVGRRMTGLYGDDAAVNQFQTAKIPGSVMAYYDSNGNIAMNERYMNSKGMDSAYDAAVAGKFHPSRGDKSGLQAVAAHEYGHALSDMAARKMGARNLDDASRQIVERARAKTNHRTNMAFAGKISGYAKYNFAECVAEAVSDWHCNGSRASKESRAVMAVLNGILKK